MKEVLYLNHIKSNPVGEILIGGSKSESNRLLILDHLYPGRLFIKNLSDSEDTRVLWKALQSTHREIDIHHAGTAMRFLTSYFAIQENKTTHLTGSTRMQERPIGILVDALNKLGAEISYLKKAGFPPIQIMGKKLVKNEVSLEANVSSQFLTSLLLIAPKLDTGLTIHIKGKITSEPYLKMTLQLLETLGIQIKVDTHTLQIFPAKDIIKKEFIVESDWSSASYYYALCALSDDSAIRLSHFKSQSLQGDREVVAIYERFFGVKTEFSNHLIELKNIKDFNFPKLIELNLNKTPDIAQTIAVNCVGLQIRCKLTGLETLKVKETDRLSALQNELKKLGADTKITQESLEITNFKKITEIPVIQTYNDHRMAMSFAPIRMKMNLGIENPEVVEKSYPSFWKDLESLFQA